MLKNKVKYLTNSILHYNNEIKCPYCHSNAYNIIDRKFVVTKLIECNNYHLYFRYPLDGEGFNRNFYEIDYEQKGGITTTLPKYDDLQSFKLNNFKNTEKNVDIFLEIFKALFPEGIIGKSLIDYGCSWGYMSYQFLKAGLSVQSYEISKYRAEYGYKMLGIVIFTKEEKLLAGNDIFFSAHVIEHLTDIKTFFTTSKNLLKNDGFFIAECPNGSDEFRIRKPKSFHKNWGLVHPNYLNSKFYKTVFDKNPYLIISSPYDIHLIKDWDQKSQLSGNLSGDNLLVISKINYEING